MNDYLIKYAVEPIYDNDSVCAYVVSKCYVLGSFEEDEEIYYRVIYPYVDKDTFLYTSKIFEEDLKYIKDYYLDIRQRPIYDVKKGVYINEQITDNVYNKLRDAQEERLRKNKDLLIEKVNHSLVKDRDKDYKKYKDEIRSMENFEWMSIKYTEDLIVTRSKVRKR